MNPQRTLTIEIRTEQNPGLDSFQLPTLTFIQDGDKFYLSSSFELIRAAIADAVIHLGSNYRHPLYFNVQVIPAAEVKSSTNTLKQQRRRRKKHN